MSSLWPVSVWSFWPCLKYCLKLFKTKSFEALIVQVRCVDVAVEEKEVVAVAAVEVEKAAAGVARGTMTGQLDNAGLCR